MLRDTVYETSAYNYKDNDTHAYYISFQSSCLHVKK